MKFIAFHFLLISTVASQGLLDGIGQLINNFAGGGQGANPPRGGPPNQGGWGNWGNPRGGWGPPRGPPPGGDGWGPGRGGPPPGGDGWGPGPSGPPPQGPPNRPGGNVLNLGGLLNNVMQEVQHVAETGHFDLRTSLAHITEGTGLEGLYQKLSLASKNFLAPKPTDGGIPPHVLRRIIRFCSRPQNQNNPQCA